MNHAESSAADSPGYLSTFSLRCEPFSDRLDSRFFYAGTTLMQRLDLLTHLTQFGDSVVLVTGPKGSGKTTLLNRFVEQASSQWRLCVLDAEAGFDQFSDRLADVVSTAPPASAQELISHWADHSDSSQRLVLAIDNADQLDGSELDQLCTILGHCAANRVRIILFGLADTQQDLNQACEKRALSCTTQRLEMPRLSEEETSSYLMYRLAVAGYSGESPFTTTEVGAICKAADGRPADINRLAHEILLERHSRSYSRYLSTRMSRARFNRLGWMIASIGALSVTTYLVWQQFTADSQDTRLASNQRRTITEVPLALPEQAPSAPAIQRSDPAQTAGQTPASAPPTLPELTEIDARQEPQRSSPAVALAKEPEGPSPPQTSTSSDETTGPVSEPVEATTSGGEDPRAAELAAAPPEQASAAAPASEEPLTQSGSVAAAQAAAVEQKANTESFPRRETWLLAQPETSFSLQLLGSRKEKSMADYIRQHQLDERQSAYYRGYYRGNTWYVLMYGIYPSKKAALEGRDRLPTKVRELKPWPRTLKSVQTAIREVE